MCGAPILLVGSFHYVSLVWLHVNTLGVLLYIALPLLHILLSSAALDCFEEFVMDYWAIAAADIWHLPVIGTLEELQAMGGWSAGCNM